MDETSLILNRSLLSKELQATKRSDAPKSGDSYQLGSLVLENTISVAGMAARTVGVAAVTTAFASSGSGFGHAIRGISLAAAATGGGALPTLPLQLLTSVIRPMNASVVQKQPTRPSVSREKGALRVKWACIDSARTWGHRRRNCTDRALPD